MLRIFGKGYKDFQKYWKNYITQSLLACGVIFIILLILNIQKNPIIIASMGSTCFVVFAMPKSRSAAPRRIIGGHLLGIICGTIFASIPHASFLHTTVESSMYYAFAVGFSIFLMAILDTEHPPAAGTALSLAINGFHPKAALAVIIASIILAMIHKLFKNKLKDLT